MEIKEIYLQTENFKNIKPNQKQAILRQFGALSRQPSFRRHQLRRKREDASVRDIGV